MSAPAGGLAAVLFDLDGLLVDSEPLWTRVEVELAQRLGGQWSREIKARIVGTRLDVSVPVILSWYGADAGPAAVAETTSWLLARMVELFRAGLSLRPGARQLLDALAEAGVPLALVSSSYRLLVDAALDSLGAARFAATVAGDEVRLGKPDPEPYRTAAALLGVEAAGCVVFEDSPSGVASAVAAGCVCVGVPDVVDLTPPPGHPVLASLAEVDLDWLCSLPSRALVAGPAAGLTGTVSSTR